MVSEMKHAVFPDTMVYLHYRPVDQIDWGEVLGAASSDDVVIVIPGVTMREIDKHKNNTPRLRTRAQRVGAQFEEWLSPSGPPLRPDLRVEAVLTAPQVDWRALGLDRDSNDDVLVASALDFQRVHGDVRVVLITQDSYPRLQARRLGLDVVALPDELRLPPEEDQLERENRELRRELQRMQAVRPVLNLRFAHGVGKTFRATIRELRPLTDNQLAKKLKEVEIRHPPAQAFTAGVSADPTTGTETDAAELVRSQLQTTLAAMRAFQDGPSANELARYERERTEYLAEYVEYLSEARAYERDRARRFVLDLELVNTGSTPALDIDVRLHVPDGVEVAESDELEPPEEPEPPTPPRTTMELLRDSMSSTLNFASLHPPVSPMFDAGRAIGPTPNVSPLRIRETNSYDIQLHVRAVKHTLSVGLPPIHIVVPDGAEIVPFQVTYSLHAANLVEPVTGELNIVLSPD
jgi:hypothetical protein